MFCTDSDCKTEITFKKNSSLRMFFSINRNCLQWAFPEKENKQGG